MMYYIEHIKKFKYMSKIMKEVFIADIIRSLLFILAGVGLYLWLNNTGLLIYLILMIKHHWAREESE